MTARLLAGPLAAFMLMPLAGCGEDLAAVPREVVVDGLQRPVAAMHDAQADVYLVACRPEGAAAYIARVLPAGAIDGRLLEHGRDGVELVAPVGLALSGDELLVADTTVVRRFDRSSGAPLGVIELAQGLEVSGLAVGPDGGVWLAQQQAQPTAEASLRCVRDGKPDLVAVLPQTDPKTDPPAGPGALVAIDTGAYLLHGNRRFFQVDNAGRTTELLAFDQDVRGLLRPGPGQWWTAGLRDRCLLVLDTKGGVRKYPDLEIDDPGLFDLDRKRQRLILPLSSSGRLLLRKL